MNNILRRQLSGALAGAVAGLIASIGLSGPVSAQTYPQRPVTIVAAYPPGGVADQMARVLAVGLSRQLGQPVTVENRAGASGMIGAAHVARAAPDGHTLLMGAMAEIVFTPHMNDKMAYQPDKDLAPVAMAVRFPFLLATHPEFPARSAKDIIALARQKPDHYTYATGGFGSVQHIAMEMFTRISGIKLHHVPYKGVAPALMGVLGNEASMIVGGFPPTIAQVHAGKLNAIGLSTRERLPVAPDIPALAETPGLEAYDFPVWVGLFAPAGTPAPILDRIHRESVAIFQLPENRAGIEKAGMTVSDESRAAFAEFVRREAGKYEKVIKEGGIKGE